MYCVCLWTTIFYYRKCEEIVIIVWGLGLSSYVYEVLFPNYELRSKSKLGFSQNHRRAKFPAVCVLFVFVCLFLSFSVQGIVENENAVSKNSAGIFVRRWRRRTGDDPSTLQTYFTCSWDLGCNPLKDTHTERQTHTRSAHWDFIIIHNNICFCHFLCKGLLSLKM